MDLWSEKNIAKYSHNHRWNLFRYFCIWYQTHYIPFLIVSPIGWKISIRFLHLHSAVPPNWASSSHEVLSERIKYETRRLDPILLIFDDLDEKLMYTIYPISTFNCDSNNIIFSTGYKWIYIWFVLNELI